MGVKEMLDNLFGRSKTIIGLDIGHDSVKAVELAQTASGLELVRYGIAEVRSMHESREEHSNDAAILAAVQRLFSESGIESNLVCSSVSGESVIVRPIPLPHFQAKDDAEFETAVRTEAKDFIPFEMDDVVFDYQRLGEKPGREGGRSTEVLIVAVKNDLINRHLSLLDAAGLEPVIIDVDSIALVNAVISGSDVDPKEAVALVNIGCNVTNIAIMRDEMTRFTRDLSFAGGNITGAIASEFDVLYPEAEELKRRCGLGFLSGGGLEPAAPSEKGAESAGAGVVQDLYKAIDKMEGQQPAEAEGAGGPQTGQREHRISELCEQVIGDIVSEVKRSLLYYENQLDGEAISRVLLSGGTAKMKGIREYFESVLDIPTELVRPFERIRSPFTKDEAEQKGPLLGVGLGLALRNVISK